MEILLLTQTHLVTNTVILNNDERRFTLFLENIGKSKFVSVIQKYPCFRTECIWVSPCGILDRIAHIGLMVMVL